MSQNTSTTINRGPRPALPEWATEETRAKMSTFLDYMEALEAGVSKKKWAKVLDFVSNVGDTFTPVEKTACKRLKQAESGEEHGAAAAALNAYMTASLESVTVSLAILTGVKPAVA